MNTRTIHGKLGVALAFGFVLCLQSITWGQGMPRISARFVHPHYDKTSNTYCLDVELRSNTPEQSLFGMNLRFFYDASKLEFNSLGDFAPGYGILGETPQAYKGNAMSGSHMFNFDGAAAYVNAAVQLMNENSPLAIPVNQWTKCFSVCFKVPKALSDEANFCPTVIWDMKANPEDGGFFRGEKGLVITVRENNPATPQETAPTLVEGISINWAYNDDAAMPYGQPVSNECMSLLTAVTSTNTILNGAGYDLYQNQPNPVMDQTLIGFTLPEAMEARLSFFDVNGRLVYTLEGDYKAGYNAVKLQKSVLGGDSANVLFYRLETANYTSEVKQMTLMTK